MVRVARVLMATGWVGVGEVSVGMLAVVLAGAVKILDCDGLQWVVGLLRRGGVECFMAGRAP